MDASTAAATFEKLNVGVSAGGTPGGAGEPIAVSTCSKILGDMSPISPTWAMALATKPALDTLFFAPGDGVSKSASAVRNRFARVTSSSSWSSLCPDSPPLRRFVPVLPFSSDPEEPAGDSSMPVTLTLPTTS